MLKYKMQEHIFLVFLFPDDEFYTEKVEGGTIPFLIQLKYTFSDLNFISYGDNLLMSFLLGGILDMPLL